MTELERNQNKAVSQATGISVQTQPKLKFGQAKFTTEVLKFKWVRQNHRFND